jgi:hypothetical protein
LVDGEKCSSAYTRMFTGIYRLLVLLTFAPIVDENTQVLDNCAQQCV